MENKKTTTPKTDVISAIIKDLKFQWENLTVLNLSGKQITDFDESVVFPPKIENLNLSDNNLCNVPTAVLNLTNIKWLDLSHNSIKYFDNTPKFCHAIEDLNLSHNKLEGPPYWVWVESPSNLAKINLSSNTNLTHSLTNEYLLQLLQFKTPVSEVIIYNCILERTLELFSTFSKAKTLVIGSPDLSIMWSNRLASIPCEGLDQCCDIRRLIISNNHIHSIESNIDIYKNLVEIDLSHNNISSVPNKFCCLENLEICVLSFNDILYLPEDMVKLKKLVCLRLDSNELCMVPVELCRLPNLKILDLYNNSLYEVPDEVTNMDGLDLAQNYLDEPDNEEYLSKKERLRLSDPGRSDGRKLELSLPESNYSPDATDDEELMNYINNCNIQESQNTNDNREPSSSPEDWDSDEYWTPCYYQRVNCSEPPWQQFIRKKMQEGNFCPIDFHVVPVAEKVRYEKLCNPKVWHIVDGQFDDLSGEES